MCEHAPVLQSSAPGKSWLATRQIVNRLIDARMRQEVKDRASNIHRHTGGNPPSSICGLALAKNEQGRAPGKKLECANRSCLSLLASDTRLRVKSTLHLPVHYFELS